MNRTMQILKIQRKRMAAVLLLVSTSWMNVNAQSQIFMLQVVEFNKVDVSPSLCLPQLSYDPSGESLATSGSYEAVLRWMCGVEGKKITIEGKQIQLPLQVSIRSVTENVNITSSVIFVGQDTNRDLIVGRGSKPVKAEARITLVDLNSKRAALGMQSVVYTILDS